MVTNPSACRAPSEAGPPSELMMFLVRRTGNGSGIDIIGRDIVDVNNGSKNVVEPCDDGRDVVELLYDEMNIIELLNDGREVLVLER